jgi:hypothetical protein
MQEQFILSQLYTLPESLKTEVLHFILFLKAEYERNSPPSTEKKQRVFGRSKGRYKMAADFDDPLEDFKDYM